MNNQESGEQETNPRTNPQPRWIARRIGAIKYCREKHRAQKQEETAIDRAARSTARATWAIAFLTLVTVGVGVSTYFILEGQLTEMTNTRKSGDTSTTAQLKVATDAASAAKAANDIATQALITSQRPYVIHHQPFGGAADQIKIFSADGKKFGGIILTPYWSNLGNTATRRLRIYISQPRAITPPFDDRTKYDFTEETNTQFTPLTLGPRGDFIVGGNSLLWPEAVSDIQTKRQWYYIFGWAEYGDGFKETPIRRIKFCEIIIEIFFDRKKIMNGAGANTTFCPVRYQCIDEQCDEQ